MSTANPQSTPYLLLFARGVIALLDLWPALTIAVREEWGGPQSADKKTWLASTIIDLFEALPSPSIIKLTPTNGSTSSVIPSIPNVDFDDLADLISQVMSDEFEANIEDNSVDIVANDIIRLWKDINTSPAPHILVAALEKRAGELQKIGITVQKGADVVDVDGSSNGSDEGEDEAMELDDDEEAPQLVFSDPAGQERPEPQVDEDGFTLVQKARRR
ncbi:hypothetical protein M231_04648 [Tremella mesenterica]|uniref:Pre-rRNA-processing protein TSR2 n=1 Tax=Tremella mesenterica TaxID=5217 RepID=A0A4Q1BK18_TREME|nr:uncharacterized protein TREMEDRAFT_44230 [Tremella mesenterica DSM 1558]EIW68965.1 hypothetical protein TREMEDRAFT_44230 [Tremella mesenterica DSM 1558]RXK38089.1 hypothetical protein M231_04648 [Tremella mesenterica]